MSIQQLQPTFTQAQFVENQSIENSSGQSNSDVTKTTPKMDLCLDDSFIGGSCLKLEADVVLNKFVKYR